MNYNLLLKCNSNQELHHVLFCGPSGAGKTYNATKILKENNIPYNVTNGAFIRNEADIIINLKALSKLSNNKITILVIDEIHALPTRAQNALLTIAETRRVTLNLHGELITYHIFPDRHFAIWGITTNPERLFRPLRNRFKTCIWIELPTVQEKVNFLFLSGVKIDSISEAVRFTHSCISYRDMVGITENAKSYGMSINSTLDMLGYDKNGLSKPEQHYINSIKMLGGTASINSISSNMEVDKETAQETERRLILKGYIKITPSGRILNG